MLQHRTSGDLDLVWLEALWKGYRGYSAALSGKLVIGKNEVKHWVHGRVGGHQILSVKDSHLTSGDLDLVVGVYGGVPMRARYLGLSGKLWIMGNVGLKNDEKSVILATTHMLLYPTPAGIHVAGSNFG